MIGLFLLFTPSDRLRTLTEKRETEGEGKPSKAYTAAIRILGIGPAAAGKRSVGFENGLEGRDMEYRKMIRLKAGMQRTDRREETEEC